MHRPTQESYWDCGRYESHNSTPVPRSYSRTRQQQANRDQLSDHYAQNQRLDEWLEQLKTLESAVIDLRAKLGDLGDEIKRVRYP
jgi:hypothetical protein